jgi:hypothetical protein
MDYETRFPEKLITADELTKLVTPIGQIVNAKVGVEMVFVVSTDDGEVSSIFDTLADNLIRNRKKAEPEARERKTRGKGKSLKTTVRLGLHSYRNTETGDVFSKQKINKMLAANELERGTKFVNGHDETFMVGTVDDDPSVPLQLIIVGE